MNISFLIKDVVDIVFYHHMSRENHGLDSYKIAYVIDCAFKQWVVNLSSSIIQQHQISVV